ncbi:hypothetical protein M409DRAFT_16648 [Zasmidium cellare ATCC 36951]|uniref:NmrA-like domain-containing protein n=1 Tax=Zasmidium cellare ATCC 36951 TaxID=1080233 RepID=A0A6A6D4W1_ZASCE|nr:uncharacterized protein M409DRAFT_16648 [Zasmidium cellare ATCC 36951]KAF2172686.1 hypothetical protein M409DRAFT_16648 [Zasmidium cellare ATCC 36951]
MSKILTVFGATGGQGGSVIDHILAHPQLAKTYQIRAITRDVTKAAALGLKEKGVEVVSADLNDKESVAKTVEGSSIVFGVTNFWETANKDIEVKQGRNIVDAAKKANVERLIFSSLVNVTKETNGRITSVKHFDGKAEIEEYARSVGVPGTYFMPSVFDIFFLGFFRKNANGEYALGLPFEGTVRIPLIDIGSDAGLFVAAILLQLPETLNKRVVASGGYVTPDEAVATFTEVTGRKAVYNNPGWDLWSSFLPPKAKEEMTGNWQLIYNPGYYAGEPENAIDEGHALVAKAGLRKPHSWKEFVAVNFKE